MIELDLNSVAIPLEWAAVFGREAPTDVEIGSGKGKFLCELAARRPERNLLAVERSPKYHRLCCDRVARRGLENVRVLRTTGEDLLFRLLAEASVSELFVLFPDPWPKKRHHKRRLIRPEIVAAMARALRPEARLLVKSDHPVYSEVIAEVLATADGLAPVDAATAFADLPLTGFEQKYAIEGRPIFAFACRRAS
jgi:tRNA (guanine-N7-)-methyltransferase